MGDCSRNPRTRGFTLLEMSIVLLIIATFLGGSVVLFMTTLKKTQYQETQSKFETIQKALLDYRKAFNRIPCPADVTYAINEPNGNFGVEASVPGDCVTSGAIRANFGMYYDVPGWMDYDVQGMVPVKTLHLPDDYAFDGWGHRIMYGVDSQFTENNAFTTHGVTTTGRLSIGTLANSGGPLNGTAVYVLMSFGPNGHGAYPRGDPSTNLDLTTSRISSGSINTFEKSNCNCDSDASYWGYGGIYEQYEQVDAPNPLASFDDIVVYGSRQDLRTPTE